MKKRTTSELLSYLLTKQLLPEFDKLGVKYEIITHEEVRVYISEDEYITLTSFLNKSDLTVRSRGEFITSKGLILGKFKLKEEYHLYEPEIYEELHLIMRSKAINIGRIDLMSIVLVMGTLSERNETEILNTLYIPIELYISKDDIYNLLKRDNTANRKVNLVTIGSGGNEVVLRNIITNPDPETAFQMPKYFNKVVV